MLQLQYLDVSKVTGARIRIVLVVLLNEALTPSVLSDNTVEPQSFIQHPDAGAHRCFRNAFGSLFLELQIGLTLFPHVFPITGIRGRSKRKALCTSAMGRVGA